MAMAVRERKPTPNSLIQNYLMRHGSIFGRADRVRYGTGDDIVVLINGKLWLDHHGYGLDSDPERFLQTIRERVSEVQDSSLG